MHSTLATQLAQLELGHLAIEAPERLGTADLPEAQAVEQTLAAIWSDLFALFPDTALEEDAEEIAWGLVNLFHRAAAKRGGQVDRATDEIRCLLASADGSEVHSTELERQVARARSAEAAMIGLEAFREAAAALYCNETGSSWRPATGSRPNHGAGLTSAVVEGRDFLRARSESRRRSAMPAGTPVLFAGGRLSFAAAEDAKAVAESVWTTFAMPMPGPNIGRASAPASGSRSRPGTSPGAATPLPIRSLASARSRARRAPTCPCRSTSAE